MAALKFTGEVWIPGATPHRIESDHEARYQFAARHASNQIILDIACGVGGGSLILAQAGAKKVDGVDINPRHINYAKRHYSHPDIHYYVGDISRFGQKESYSLIICYETIEHIRDYERAIRHLYALLIPGGMLLISSPNRTVTSPFISAIKHHPHNKFHTQEFTPPELISLLKKVGFKVSPKGIFGQRFRWHFSNSLLHNLYQLLFNPDNKSSPQVRRLRFLTPRYFLIQAHK